jgi:hypothetical protein
MGHAELLRDLGQVFRRTLVTLGRGARNDLEVPDLGQAGENFILDAVGEIGVTSCTSLPAVTSASQC